MRDAKALLKHLEVTKIEDNVFEGASLNIGSPNIYGGQVLGQSLNAAYQTVDETRLAHSIHAYFILAGDFTLPVTYRVEIIRDGRSFTTRNVKAIQKDRVIFESIVSFQIEEKNGYTHQIKKPWMFRTPNFLLTWEQYYSLLKTRLPKKMIEWFSIDRPIEFWPVEIERYVWKRKWTPIKNVWFRFKGADKIAISYPQLQQMLLYASDYNLLMTAMEPHPTAHMGNVQMASIDHAMWFHNPCKPDEYMLYHLDSPSASNSRGFTRGNIFSKSGILVASVAQEGLMRPLEKNKK